LVSVALAVACCLIRCVQSVAWIVNLFPHGVLPKTCSICYESIQRPAGPEGDS
jgi:hypothetical protein